MRYILLFSWLLLFQFCFAQSWAPIADFGNVGRHRAAGFSIGNKGYAGIGHKNGTGVNIVYSDWWEYDPASNSWTQKADYANGVGSYGAIVFSTDTHGYIGGGTAFTSEFFKFDPITNTWTAIANCPVNANDQTAFAINNKGYVIDNANFVQYDPATDTWAFKQSLPQALSIWSSSFVVDGSAFVKNGYQLYEYKASTDSWITRSAFPGLASGGSSGFTLNKKGYIVTGYQGGLANTTNEVWEFNPATNLWTQLEDFEGSSRRFSVAFTVNSRAYFGTGTNGINFNDFWAFDNSYADVQELTITTAVYPNPASSVVHFEAYGNISGTSTLYLFDANGKEVAKIEFEGNSYTWTRTSEPNGSYFYRLKNNDKWSAQGTLQLSGL